MNLMDAKKRQSSKQDAKGSDKGSLRKAAGFFGEVKNEIQRITWTNKQELRVYTKIVVGATFSLGIMIYGIDLFIRSMLMGLSNIVHWIAG